MSKKIKIKGGIFLLIKKKKNGNLKKSIEINLILIPLSTMYCL